MGDLAGEREGQDETKTPYTIQIISAKSLLNRKYAYQSKPAQRSSNIDTKLHDPD